MPSSNPFTKNCKNVDAKKLFKKGGEKTLIFPLLRVMVYVFGLELLLAYSLECFRRFWTKHKILRSLIPQPNFLKKFIVFSILR
jgi:hypothetical protein